MNTKEWSDQWLKEADMLTKRYTIQTDATGHLARFILRAKALILKLREEVEALKANAD